MLQRNDSGQALGLPTLSPPRLVEVGEEIDHPELLAGFTAVKATKSKPDPEAPAEDTTEEKKR